MNPDAKLKQPVPMVAPRAFTVIPAVHRPVPSAMIAFRRVFQIPENSELGALLRLIQFISHRH